MWKVEAVAGAKNPRTEVTDAEVGVQIQFMLHRLQF